jgi:hypothetical protein
MPTLISEKTVTARKPHVCQCCGGIAVKPGDTYNRATYVYDGRVYDWVSCTECQAVAGDVFEYAGDPEGGVGLDVYQEWAEDAAAYSRNDAVREAAKAYLARLAAGAVA